MGKQILITGGAGFIGSHLADELLKCGDRVRVLDNLSEQVHGSGQTEPDYLSSEVELVIGDVRDAACVKRSLDGVEAVYHLAARVGVGQSMYEFTRYVDANNLGTAVLLQTLIEKPVERLIVASSMSIYGEGLYVDRTGSIVAENERPIQQLQAGEWDLRDSAGDLLISVPTPETKTPSLRSIYALSKYDQECMCLLVGRAYGIPTVALRFFNVFGTRQALNNPYTGVIAIVAARLLNGKAPLIFEDGLQQRDFVSVHDVVQACCLALATPAAAGQIFNVGNGRPQTILGITQRLAKTLEKEYLEPVITKKYRAGDIRHCYADISQARSVLGYAPNVSIEQGMAEIGLWLQGQIAIDRVSEASDELLKRGLVL